MTYLMKASVWLLFFTLPLIGNAQHHTDLSNKWHEIERLIAIKNYEQTLPLLADIKAEARRSNNSAAWVRAFMAESQAKKVNNTDDSAFVRIERHFRHNIRQASPVEQAILNNFYAQFLASNIQRYLSKSDNPFIASTGKDKLKYIDSVFRLSLEPKELLLNESIDRWADMFIKRQNRSLSPTLFHFLTYQYLDFLSGQNRVATIADIKEDMVAINKKKQYADATTYMFTLGLPIPYQNEPEDSTVSTYTDIINKYPSDYNAYLLYLMADRYNKSGNKRKANQIIHQALEQYPNSPWIDNAKNLLKTIKQAQIQVKSNIFAPADQYTPLKISSTNIDSVYIRVYNTTNRPKNYKEYEIHYDSLSFHTTLDAPLVYEEQVELGHFDDHKNHTTLFRLKPLPFGHYTILVSNNNAFKDDGLYLESTSHEIVISDLFISASQDREIGNISLFKGLLINRKTGIPYVHKQIQLYDLKRDHSMDLVQTFRTDTKGEFFYESKYGADIDDFYLYIPQEDQLIDLTILQSIERHINYGTVQDKGEQITVQTLTDRAIYRPGQQLYFKSILYNSNALLGKAMEKQEIKIYLQDANRQKIDSLTLTSNAYGSVNGSFQLPNITLSGSFSILSFHKGRQINTHYFRVEEYKRPTFKVTFDINKETYTLQDTAIFTGKAESLSGAMLSHTPVKYKVTFYDRVKRQSITYLDSTLTTDDEGRFALEVPLTDSVFRGRDNFSLQYIAEVTNQNGEMQAASGNYNFSTRPGRIQVQTDIIVAEKQWKKLQIRTTNQNGQPLPLNGKVNIYKVTEPRTVLTRENSRYFYDIDYHILSREDYEKYFPAIFDRSLLTQEEQKELIAAYDFDTRDTSLVRIDSNLFSPGLYKIEAISVQQRDTIMTSAYTQVYDTVSKKVSNNEFLTVSLDKSSYAIGDEVTISYQTDAKNAKYLYLFMAQGSVKEPTQLLQLKKGTATYRFTLRKEHTFPNLSFTALLVVDNKSAIISSRIPLNRKNKTLTLKSSTFRDKITPGQKEKWRFNVSQEDLPVGEAEVLATMYDAALDAFAGNGYPSSLYLHSPYYSDLRYHYLIEEFHQEDYSSPIFSKNLSFSALDNSLSQPYTYDLWNLRNWYYYRASLDGENTLDEVVVVSYGSQKKMTMTGSVATIDGQAMADAPVADVANLLQGKVAGLSLEQNSGAPGMRGEVLIRGLSNSAEQGTPLYVVDGEIVDHIKDIAPDEIESIEVLKDGAAAALYGSRGANGVLLITTKTGKKKQKLLDRVQARTNLQETAFFYPTLYTDAEGNTSFEFDSPEALTKWKLLLFAHDKDLRSGTATFFTRTQKQLMVRPNLPRYLREGDEIVLKAQIQNMSQQQLRGYARIEILNPEDNKDISNLFLKGDGSTSFEVPAVNNTVVEWKLKIPSHIPTVHIKIIAATDSFSDGELVELPILSNKVLISDTEKIILKPGETKTYDLHGVGKENLQAKIQVQLNPILEIISALDYLKHYPYTCTEQSSSKWFGLKMVQYLAKHYPEIAAYFKKLNADASRGKLTDNSVLSELKQEEMPWLRDIQGEQKKLIAIAVLFNSDLQAEINAIEQKIIKNQLADGAFPWFEGGRPDNYISIRVLEITGKVLQLDQSLLSKNMLGAMTKLTQYLDQDNSIVSPTTSFDLRLSYLYARHYWNAYFKIEEGRLKELTSMLFNSPNLTAIRAAGIAAKAWVVNQLYGNAKQSNELRNRISQEVIQDKDKGMYWPSNDIHYNSTSLQAYLVEAYSINDPSKLQAITQWLYYKKQANHWFSTWMTVDAIYALLRANNPDDFKLENKVTLLVDQQQPQLDESILGQLSIQFGRDELNMDKHITVQNNNSRTIYGGIYHQYFVPLSEVKRNTNALSIQKQYLVERNGTWVETQKARLGERIKVKIIVINDAPLQYVHLKDSRPSGVEPIYQPSGYRWWQGYYFSMKDASTNYFFEHLGKGKIEFEYEIKANNIGIFNSGISSIECMYDPTVNARSANIQLIIVP